MAVSQNGYSANDRSVIQSYQVGEVVKVSLRKGSTGATLAHFGTWFDDNIRDIDTGILDDWGYAERLIRGSVSDLSNHASGTALDLDATKWALGSRATRYLTQPEIDRIHVQLRFYEGCIRWGDDYGSIAFGGKTGSRTDPMHFEINADQATVDRVWAKIAGGAVAPTTNPSDPSAGMANVETTPRKFQAWYNAYPFAPALLPVIKPLADNWGPQSEAALKKVQARFGLAADGICGPQTKALLWRLGYR